MSKLQYNEKPTSINNIGNDIPDASRHRFNTYTDEQKIERERKKSEKKSKDTLKDEYQSRLEKTTDRNLMISLLKEYEFKKACNAVNFQADHEQGFREYVLSCRNRVNVKAYNKYTRAVHKLNWLSDDKLNHYFETKKVDKYNHVTGVKKSWKCDDILHPLSLEYFQSNVKAVQFGNSLSESERVFNLNRLMAGLEDLKQHVKLDFTRIGFSFGARGKAGSVAHYQDSARVIAINRNRCGSMVHEIGHALDYQKGMLSERLPDSLVNRYREKVLSNPALKVNKSYLMNKKEIFARAFEAYISTLLSNEYMLDGDRTDWPELDSSDIAWMKEQVIK